MPSDIHISDTTAPISHSKDSEEEAVLASRTSAPKPDHSSRAKDIARFPAPRNSGGEDITSESQSLRRRGRPLSHASSDADVELALEAPQAKLQRLAPGASAEHRNLAIEAAHALYGRDLSKVPDDLLRSLVRQAPIFIEHHVTTEAALRKFFNGSWGEVAAPLIGRSGYMLALSLMGSLAGSHIPQPFTGLPIGATVMFTTMNSGGLRDGLEARRYPALETSGLPPSLQHRYQNYARDLLPPGLRAELTRQLVRATVTLIPVVIAMSRGTSLDRTTMVHNDVLADAATFMTAENIDAGVQKAWTAIKDVFPKIYSAVNDKKDKGLQAPAHEELVAHMPPKILEPRLAAHQQSTLQSIGDSIKGMGEGWVNLWANQHGRLIGVPMHAGVVIAMALGMTSFLIDLDSQNEHLPEGQISPRSALAVPATLMGMEIIATLAFASLLQACDAKSWKKPLEPVEEHDPLEGFWGRESELTPLATKLPEASIDDLAESSDAPARRLLAVTSGTPSDDVNKPAA